MTHYGRVFPAQVSEIAKFSPKALRTARSKLAIFAHRTVKKRRVLAQRTVKPPRSDTGLGEAFADGTEEPRVAAEWAGSRSRSTEP